MKNNLEKIRKERGLTQADLVAALKVSRQTISSIENGRYNPSLELAFEISIFFNLSIEEIFIFEKSKE